MSYTPLHVSAYETGLVKNRVEFILPNDAYPVLENAYVWRERIKRKKGYKLLGRLRRIDILVDGNNLTGSTIDLKTVLALGTNAQIEPGSINIVGVVDGTTYTDLTEDGVLLATGGTGTGGSINYVTGVLTITAGGGQALTGTFNYFPNLPAMGLRQREQNNVNNEQLIAFDTTYAYKFTTGWEEYLPGTTWTGNDSDFFWSTNWWVSAANDKLFWVTNNTDPIRYTDNLTWNNFAPRISNGAPADVLNNCLCMLPFRGRLLVFNTNEGAVPTQYYQRIRWSAIGNPIPNGAYQPWFDDVPGLGGFLDIPTSQAIVSVGFVRDNLVIYCESSTWQLRYTGRSIAPFQIERVNSELGAESTFSAVQFDTSLVGIGDKGVVRCDSFKSDRIDIKIPDLVFDFNNDQNGTKRVHGIRDFFNRLAFWTYPYKPLTNSTTFYPNRRLVYNYENDSWAIFTDSLTCLGNYQPLTSTKWQDANYPWQEANFPWLNRPALFPAIVGGNQQGYIEILDSKASNDQSLFIQGITGNDPNVTVIISPDHNLQPGQVIQIVNIPSGTPFDNLNDQYFAVGAKDQNTFQIYLYDTANGLFTIPQVDAADTYIGGGEIKIRDNFIIQSKKFNFVEEGQNIQIGYIDVLLDTTDNGAITLNMYLDYNDNSPVNQEPENNNPDTNLPDNFFNQTVPTSSSGGISSLKLWQRVFCATRGAFLTIEWTLSNAQLIGEEQEKDVQIQSQIIWMRRAGKQLPSGF